MRIQLPAETWIEILNWLRRRDLIKKLDQLWDREFTPIVQDWFHKYTRNVCIRPLIYGKDTAGFGLHDFKQPIPFPEVELPTNITDFVQITIAYLDSDLLAFLHRIHRLFCNVHLYIGASENGLQNVQIALRHLLPLIGDRQQIGGITLTHAMLALFNDANLQTVFFNVKLLLLFVWQTLPDLSVQFLNNWLFTARQDGEPRMLLIISIIANQLDGFIKTIRQRFLDPTRQLPSSFFVRFTTDGTLAASVFENVRTGEQLGVQNIKHDNKDYWLVTNCPLGIGKEWLAKKREEVLDWDIFQQQTIRLNSPETGPLLDAEDCNHQLSAAGGN